MNENKCVNLTITLNDFPEKFKINKQENLYVSYQFDTFSIRNILNYTKYIGIEPQKQRLFSIIFMRLMPTYILGEGSLDLDCSSNRLIIYLSGHKPITFAHIE